MKMLSCRTLLRIDRVLRFTSRCVKPKPKSFSIMSFRENEAMDGFKKQKMANLVWRPISTQPSSVTAEAGNEVQEAAQCSKSSDVSGEVAEVKAKELLNETTSAVSAEKHSVSLEVGASLIRFIRGKEGTTQTQIEEEMGVKIILPSSRNEDHIIIEGSSADSITKASERIMTIIDEVVKSPSLDYSHFVSLPLAIHPGLVDKLVNFQNSILGNNSIAGDEQDDQANRSNRSVAVNLEANSETNQVNVDIKSIPTVSYPPKTKEKSSTLLDMGIEKSIFIKPNTFHLTVLMLKLWNKDRVKEAQDVLKSIYPSVMDSLDNRPIFIRLKGLDCMRGPLAKARVLYVPVEEIGDEGRLLRACQVITDAFVKAGLVLEKDAKQSLKLHATVMNARHRKRRKDNRKKMETFDAREIHKQFGNEDWGEYLIREAHLSQRFVFDQNGYYRCCASITFPGEQRA